VVTFKTTAFSLSAQDHRLQPLGHSSMLVF